MFSEWINNWQKAEKKLGYFKLTEYTLFLNVFALILVHVVKLLYSSGLKIAQRKQSLCQVSWYKVNFTQWFQSQSNSTMGQMFLFITTCTVINEDGSSGNEGFKSSQSDLFQENLSETQSNPE